MTNADRRGTARGFAPPVGPPRGGSTPVRDLALRFTWLLTKWGCVATCYYCLLNGA